MSDPQTTADDQKSSHQEHRGWRGNGRPTKWAEVLVAVRWPLTLLLIVLMGWTLLAVKSCSRSPMPSPPSPPQPRAISQNYFDALIAPLARENDIANRQAADRCVASLQDSFRRYHQGVPRFATDVTSMGTRFVILRKMPFDWWYQQDNVMTFTKEMFGKHVFSGPRLKSDISAALETFRQDIRSNRGSMLVKVKAAISEGNFPAVPVPEYDDFTARVMEDISTTASATASDSIYHGVATLLASELASTVAMEAVVKLLPTIAGAAAAETAMTAGGATAAATAAGGGGGSVVGPVGTAVGVAAGLAIGIAADWWLTESYKSKLTKQIDDYLTGLEFQLLDSPDAEKPGLRYVLTNMCDDLARAEDAALRGIVIEATR